MVMFGVAVAVPPTPAAGGPAGLAICTPKLPFCNGAAARMMKEPFQPATEFPEMVTVLPDVKLVRLEVPLSAMTAPVMPELGMEELGMAKTIGTAAPEAETGRVAGAV